MTPEQERFLELVETLMTCASEDQVYRHLRLELGGKHVFIEDTVTAVTVSVNPIDFSSAKGVGDWRRGVVIDMARGYKKGVPPTIHTWNEALAAYLQPLLQ